MTACVQLPGNAHNRWNSIVLYTSSILRPNLPHVGLQLTIHAGSFKDNGIRGCGIVVEGLWGLTIFPLKGDDDKIFGKAFFLRVAPTVKYWQKAPWHWVSANSAALPAMSVKCEPGGNLMYSQLAVIRQLLVCSLLGVTPISSYGGCACLAVKGPPHNSLLPAVLFNCLIGRSELDGHMGIMCATGKHLADGTKWNEHHDDGSPLRIFHE